jgi:hypothetical protein
MRLVAITFLRPNACAFGYGRMPLNAFRATPRSATPDQNNVTRQQHGVTFSQSITIPRFVTRVSRPARLRPQIATANSAPGENRQRELKAIPCSEISKSPGSHSASSAP